MGRQKAILNEFQGFEVKRTKNDVQFGCGEVVVSKKDLLAAAEIAETPEFKKGVKLFTKLAYAANGNMSIEDIAALTPATFRALVGSE